jgi:hypothetical protein
MTSAGTTSPAEVTPRRQAENTTPPPKRPPATSPSPTAQELNLFRTLQSTALQARRSALDAGATTDQLQDGDEHNKMAASLIQQGKVSEAADRLDRAATAWGAAERTARAVAAATQAKAAAPPDPVKQQPTAPPIAPPVSASSSSAPVVQPSAPAVQQSSASASAEISGVVAAYARAIESRDLGAVRRAYRGITPAQAKAFGDFFGSVRSLRANLSVGGLEISGNSAEARLVGVYEFVTGAGKTERQQVGFQAVFRREAGSWELTSIR